MFLKDHMPDVVPFGPACQPRCAREKVSHPDSDSSPSKYEALGFAQKWIHRIGARIWVGFGCAD
jgi:hypothetical protein